LGRERGGGGKNGGKVLKIKNREAKKRSLVVVIRDKREVKDQRGT